MRPAAVCRAKSRSGSCRRISRRAATSATSRSWCGSASRSAFQSTRLGPRVVLRAGQDGVVAAERHAAVLGITGVPTFIFDRQYTHLGRPRGRYVRQGHRPGRGVRGRPRNGARDARRADRSRAQPHRRRRRIRRAALHAHAVAPFLNLRRAALASRLRPDACEQFSRFRAPARRSGTRKYSGAAPIYDAVGAPLDAARLAPAERIDRHSAMVGAARARAATTGARMWISSTATRVGAGYRVQLTAAEFTAPGPFAPLAQWLEANAAALRILSPVPRRAVGRAARAVAFQLRAGGGAGAPAPSTPGCCARRSARRGLLGKARRARAARRAPCPLRGGASTWPVSA